MRRGIERRLVAVAILSHAALAVAGPQFSILDLGAISTDASGNSSSSANGINNSGRVVGTSAKYDAAHADKYLGNRAFVWSGGQGMIELPTLGGVDSYYGQNNSTATAINQSGVVVGTSEKYNASGTSLGQFAFSYTGGTLTQLGTIGSSAYNVATAINTSGTIVGRATQVRIGHLITDQLAATFTPSQATALPIPLNTDGDGTNGNYYSSAYGVNTSGQITGQYKKYSAGGTAYGTRGFVYDPATSTTTTLPTFGTQSGTGKASMEVYGMNDVGNVVGDSTMYDPTKGFQGIRSFLWASGANALTEIGNLGVDSYGQTQSYAKGINNRNQVVGTAYRYDASHVRVGSGNRAYFYNDGTTYDLNDLVTGSGWSLLSGANGINDAGQIVGQGINSLGKGHAYLLTPIAMGISVTSYTGMLNGAYGQSGAIQYAFTGQSTAGTLSASWASISDPNSSANQSLYSYAPVNFTLSGPTMQLLSLTFEGSIDPGASAAISLYYDPAQLGAGVDASALGIYHYHDGSWQFIGGTVDTLAHSITFQTDSFSPFAVGVTPIPEPASLSLVFLGGMMLLRRKS